MGAAAFAVFWGLAVLDVSSPWIGQLAIHGVSIAGISLGLALLVRGSDVRERALFLVGTSLVVVGLLTVLPLAFIGLALVAIWSIRSGSSAVGALLLIGAVSFLWVFVAGGRPGYEDAPELQPAIRALALVGIAGIASGLTALGIAGRPLDDRATA